MRPQVFYSYLKVSWHFVATDLQFERIRAFMPILLLCSNDSKEHNNQQPFYIIQVFHNI
jgi:hypothetical protein